MLKGEKLGQAIKQAIALKKASGAISTKVEVAKHFGVKPPSVADWEKKGSIAKDKLPELWRYFSDVVGPDHWGMTHWPQAQQAKTDAITALLPRVPLIHKSQVVDWLDGKVLDTDDAGAVASFIAHQLHAGDKAFAFIEDASSMPGTAPEGCIVVIDPVHISDEREVPNGIYLSQVGSRSYLGELLVTPSGMMLQFHNRSPGWEPIQITASDIIGKFIGSFDSKSTGIQLR